MNDRRIYFTQAIGIAGKIASITLRKALIATSAILLGTSLLKAQSFDLVNGVTNYGWLDQHSLDNINSNNFIGNEACVPTSSVNAFTYLQNTYGSIFGTNLSGSSYAEWVNTDQELINLYGTQARTATNGGGTTPQNFVNGIQSYIQSNGFASDISISSMYSSQASVTNSFNSNSTITIPFIETALEDNAALLVSIDYTGTNGGGHEILVNGLQWNGTDSGTLYFVDPLDPSQQYNGTNVLGPTLQTESESFTKTNGELLLTYSQLHDNNLTNSPPNPADDTIIAQAYVRGGLSLTVVPEPSTYALLALGALFLIIALSRRSSPLTPRVE